MHSRAAERHRPAMPLVLVHGVAVSHRYLMPLAAELSPHHPVHVVDLPGFGLSTKPAKVLDVAGLADHLAEWLDRGGVGPAALVGNSFGCQVVADLAARHGEYARCLVLAGPTMDPHARTAGRQVGRWLRDLRHEDPFQAAIISRDVLDAGPLRTAATFRHGLRDRVEQKLRAVTAPTLVTRGALEPLVPQRWAEEAASLAPRGELAVVPGSPHNANYCAPVELARIVLPFLQRVDGPRTT
jgi:pimeloyl-ACP methyl ester carboxylesterase